MEKQRRLRTWLVNMINSGKVEGLEWINAEKSLFKIPWKHESRNDWQPAHAQIFTEWARFTGKYVEGRDKPDHKMFKTRLRCAFNKAPDIEELPDMRKYKGVSPYRVYRLLKSDKKVIAQPRTRVMPEAVAALRSKLTAHEPAPVPPHVESLADEAAAEKSEEDSDKFASSRFTDAGDNLPKVEAKYKNHNSVNIVKSYHNYSDEKPMLSPRYHQSPVQQAPPAPQPTDKHAHYSPPQQHKHEMKEEPPKPAMYAPTAEQKDAQSLVLLQSTRYRGTLLKNLHNLQKDGILCDLLLRSSGGQVIPVHANVMCASSPFFKQKVDHWEVGHSGDTMDSCMTIEFLTIPFDILNSIIQFIYVGEFEVARAALPIVSEAAHEMHLDDLIILCDHVLKALRSNGGLCDEKAWKPGLPKQGPLMGFPTAVSKDEQLPTHVKQHNQTSHIHPIPAGKPVAPPLSVSKPMAVQPLIIPPPSQDDWHIPVGKGRLASSNSGTSNSSGVTPNPLDVLCQAVDETIRTESQSDSDQEKAPLVIDESRKFNIDNDKSGDGDSVYSPPPLTINMPSLQAPRTTPLTITLPLLPPTASSQPLTIPMPFSGVSMATSASLPPVPATFPGSVPTIINMPPKLPDASSVQDVRPRANEVAMDTSDGGRASPTGGRLSRRDTAGRAMAKARDGEPPSVQKFQCHVCHKVLTGKSSLQTHMNKHTGSKPFTCKFCGKCFRYGSSRHYHQMTCVRVQHRFGTAAGPAPEPRRHRRSSSADKSPGRASDEDIQSIIQRIKKQVPVAEQVSNRGSSAGGGSGGGNGAKRGQRSRSEAGTESSPIVIMPDVTRSSSHSRQSAPLSTASTGNQHAPLIVTGPFSSPSSESVVSHSETDSAGSSIKQQPPLMISLPGPIKLCAGCSESFTEADQLAAHKKQCSALGYKHICEECGKRFKTPATLQTHLEWHSSMKALTCKECQKVCKNTLLLKLHVEMHASGKFRFRCDSCSKSFLTKNKLEQHVKDHIKEKRRRTTEPMKFKCQYCAEEFLEKFDFTKHLQSHPQFQQLTRQEMMVLLPDAVAESAYHSSATPVTSGEHILPRLSTPESLGGEHHAQLKSPDVEIVVEAPQQSTCLICNEGYADEVKKLTHLSKHFKKCPSDPTKYICQHCDDVVEGSEFEEHERAHASSKLQCPVCPAEFQHEQELNRHFNEDHDEAEFNRSATNTPLMSVASPRLAENPCYKCPDVTFPSSEALQQHMLSHYATTARGKGPLVCPVCSRLFTSKYATYEFKRHMCSHTGEKPIPCRFCDKKFKDYSGRSQHEKRVHNRGPLARGRRKGYKMDRDQLYSPPQAHHYMEEDGQAAGDAGLEQDRTPPPLLSLSEHMHGLVPAADESDDSSEDMSLAAAVRGVRRPPAPPRNHPAQQVGAHKPPVNVVRPALVSLARGAERSDQPAASSSTMHLQLSPPAASIPPLYQQPRERPPLELLNHLAASKGAPPPSILNPAAIRPGIMNGQPPGFMIAHLSDAGVPHVSVDQSTHVVSGRPMPMDGMPYKGMPARPPFMIGMPPLMPTSSSKSEAPAAMSQAPLIIRPPQMNWPHASVSPTQVTHVRPGMVFARPPFMFMAHQKGYQDAKTIFDAQSRAPNQSLNANSNGDR